MDQAPLQAPLFMGDQKSLITDPSWNIWFNKLVAAWTTPTLATITPFVSVTGSPYDNLLLGSALTLLQNQITKMMNQLVLLIANVSTFGIQQYAVDPDTTGWGMANITLWQNTTDLKLKFWNGVEIVLVG
jgi:hypothetical protein